MSEEKKKDKSVIGAIAGTFTLKWLIQSIAAWGVSIWLTKLWKKYVKNDEKEKKKNGSP